jgi:hypothetical protein
MSKVNSLPLKMFKGDTLDKKIVSSDGLSLALIPEEEAFPDRGTKSLLSVEYSRKDAILHFVLSNGSQVDVPLVSLYSFGEGKQGKRGDKGRRGKDGRIGRQGATGTKGCPGMPGVTGKTGLAGEKGPTGPSGEKGPRGDRGPVGIQGLKGYQGYPNTDVNDPWANFIDPASVGDKGRDGVNGQDCVHSIFVREAEPPKHIGPYTIWSHLYEYIPEPIFKKHYAPCCFDDVIDCSTDCPTTPCPIVTSTTTTTTTSSTTTVPIELLTGVGYVASGHSSTAPQAIAAVSIKDELQNSSEDFQVIQDSRWDGDYTYTVFMTALNNTSGLVYGKLNLEVKLGSTVIRSFSELSNYGSAVLPLEAGTKLTWGAAGDLAITLFDHQVSFVATWTPDTGGSNIPLTVNGFITRKTLVNV